MTALNSEGCPLPLTSLLTISLFFFLLSRLRDEIEAAKGESLRSFGSDKLLIEKYFTSIRHVEVSSSREGYMWKWGNRAGF